MDFEMPTEVTLRCPDCEIDLTPLLEITNGYIRYWSRCPECKRKIAVQTIWNGGNESGNN